MKEFDIELNHSICLEMFDMFLHICKEENIKFVIAEGTALGAVRHEGFIPWDVNIDVDITVDEYKKLDEVAEKYLKENFLWENPKEYGRICKWIVNKEYKTLSPVPNIDIGLICGTSKYRIMREINSFLVYYYTKMYALKCKKVKRKFPFNILKIISICFPDKFYLNYFNKIAAKYPIDNSEYLIHLTPGRRCESKPFKKEIYYPEKEIKFEGRSVYIAREYVSIYAILQIVAYLKSFYGDYLTPVKWDNKGEYSNVKKDD